MIVTKQHLSRRTVLRGLGTAIALPMLDAMAPAFAGTQNATPVRMSFCYVPNGMMMANWTPKGEGRDFEFTRILKPLEPYRQDLLVLSGLDHHNGNALGDGGGDHARAGATFLTGVHPKKTMGLDIYNGISVDQVAAQALSAKTRFGSIELGCEDTRTVGNCDTGYSCAYTNSISWRTPTTPMPPETNPRMVFERLFGSLDTSLDPAARARMNADRKSILDVVDERTNSLLGKLGPSDRRKMDEYMYAIRDIEKRIQSAEKENRQQDPTIEKPTGIPATYAEHVKLMYDLQVVAFQTDLTRVITMVYSREASAKPYPEIGVSDGHHPVSHHRNDPVLLEKLCKINCFHLELFSYFVGKLKSTPDGEGSLLDHSMIVYGSSLSDSNRHLHEDLPILLAGRGDGSIKPGRRVIYPQGTPMTNLYLGMLDRMGVKAEKLGDSTGPVERLSDV